MIFYIFPTDNAPTVCSGSPISMFDDSPTCSGIETVINPSGTNATQFKVVSSGIQNIGKAVLVGGQSEGLCSSYNATRLIGGFDELQGIQCSVSFDDDDIITFQCPGEDEATLVPEGEAILVFESQRSRPPCEGISGNITAFKIDWKHNCELL